MRPKVDAIALILVLGIIVNIVLTATIAFAVLPALGTESFVALSLVLGCCFVPMGALLTMAQHPWQLGLLTATTVTFVSLLAPTNPMTFDPEVFYNTALTVVGGVGAGALAFRLLPAPSPAFRTRRLLALTLDDLRRLARGRRQNDWEGRVNSRVSALPANATPLHRAQLMAARLAGDEIIRLRCIARRLGFVTDLDVSLASVVRADSAVATANLARLDAALAARVDVGSELQMILRARGSIATLSELLAEHAAYFDAGRSA